MSRMSWPLAGLALAAVLSCAHAEPAKDTIKLGGAVQRPSVLGAKELAAFPAVTQQVDYLSGSGAQSHTYTGASLWGVIDAAGIKTDPAVKNDVLNRYVVATGSDGYRAVFSAGELNPGFGNRQSLIAYSETVGGANQPVDDGFARVTSPGDVRGGRYVSDLISLDVHRSASTFAATGGGRSTSFSVGGDVLRPTSFDLGALRALPSVTQTVGTTTYTGASFWDLLNTTVGLRTDADVKNDVLGMYVVATGTDGYRSVFSMGELNPGFGNQPDLIAYEANGEALTDNGFARLVVPNDLKAGRFVSNLASIEVFHAISPVPEPSTIAMMLAGLAMVGWRVRARRSSSYTAEPRPLQAG